MKIQRVSTLSFAISEDEEKKAEENFKRFAKGKILGLIGKKQRFEITKAYTQIARYNVKKPELVKKGIIESTEYEIKENYFYVDMTYGELYHISNHNIERYDILKRVSGLPRESIRTLGRLIEFGTTKRDELNEDAVFQLLRTDLIKIYKPMLREISTLIVDELTPENGRHTIVKDRVKPSFHLPNFTDAGYNLSNFLKTTDTIAESYKKEPIKYSIDHINSLLQNLFNAEATLGGIVFMPYIKASYVEGGKIKSVTPGWIFPVCFIDKKVKRYKKGIKLRPISLSTEVDVTTSVPVERETINFSDVAGLSDVKEEIRNEIIYPLIRPDIVKKFGRKGGGEILLYGPPGCGKTYIARATIGECGASFFNINISDLVSGGADTGPKVLHDIFEKAAKNAPSIIYLDEIDAVGGKREPEQEYKEKMLIDQLLMEMDGVESLTENVLFIAATNTPWSIDPALRRAERFTKQIFIPPPDLNTRIEIFKIHTRKEPISPGIDFKELAELTEGYASSDIKAICDSAAEIPWEEALHGGVERKIEMQDFLKAISRQKSSLIPWFKTAQREIEKSGEIGLYKEIANYILKYGEGIDQSKKPEINFSDVGNLEWVKEEIRKEIIYPIKNPELAEKFGKVAGSGDLLLYGPPGCGKTYIVRAAAGECEAAFFNVRISDIISEELGKSEKELHNIFDRASRNTPAILFFDEIDAIARKRALIKGEYERRLVNQFLIEMDGFMQHKGLMVIAATSTPWSIDPALRRAERFTKQIFIPPPDLNTRIEIFKIHTRKEPISPGIDFKELAELTEGYASSDIKAICDSAAEIPWEEALHGRVERKIEMQDFLKAIRRQKSSLIPWFELAKKELEKSGEKSVYKEMFDKILEFETKRRITTVGIREKKAVDIIKDKKKFSPGAIYLVEEEKPEKSIDTFTDLISLGLTGLYITREHPETVKERYGLKNVLIIWLTSTHEYKNHIDPANLLDLSYTIRQFISEGSVILLDGLEYIITQNEYEPVLKLIQSLNDSIASTKSILILPINPRAFNKKELALLERECRKVFT